MSQSICRISWIRRAKQTFKIEKSKIFNIFLFLSKSRYLIDNDVSFILKINSLQYIALFICIIFWIFVLNIDFSFCEFSLINFFFINFSFVNCSSCAIPKSNFSTFCVNCLYDIFLILIMFSTIILKIFWRVEQSR